MDPSTKHAHCVVQWLNKANIGSQSAEHYGTLLLWWGFKVFILVFFAMKFFICAPNTKTKTKYQTVFSGSFYLKFLKNENHGPLTKSSSVGGSIM
jgi:hypothetical protein